jgi:hypothetical protein
MGEGATSQLDKITFYSVMAESTTNLFRMVCQLQNLDPILTDDLDHPGHRWQVWLLDLEVIDISSRQPIDRARNGQRPIGYILLNCYNQIHCLIIICHVTPLYNESPEFKSTEAIIVTGPISDWDRAGNRDPSACSLFNTARAFTILAMILGHSQNINTFSKSIFFRLDQ